MRLLGADGVLTSEAVEGSTSINDFGWPFRPRDVPTGSDESTRRALAGTELAAGEQLVPILGLEVTRDLRPGGRAQQAPLTGLVLDWRATDGNSGSTELPYDLTSTAQTRGC